MDMEILGDCFFMQRYTNTLLLLTRMVLHIYQLIMD